MELDPAVLQRQGRHERQRTKQRCNTDTGTSVSSIRTSSGGSTGNFNGCWLTIDIQIPTNYTAPQNGWWKMQYTMHNSVSGTATSNDVTTWTAEIQGNPVHLVVP